MRQDGEVTVVAGAGSSGQAQRDLVLNHNVNLVQQIGHGEEPLQDWRSDVVRQVAVNSQASPRSDCGEIEFQNVARNDGEIRILLGQPPQASDQRCVKFDGANRCSAGGEIFRHFAVSGADLHPAGVFIYRACTPDGVARHSDRTRNLFAALEVGEKVLAESLPSHAKV